MLARLALKFARLAPLVCALAAILPATGCHRAAFRIRANNEMKALITEKSNDPRWELLDFTLEMDCRSRYFDPTNVDRPPMPQDDPAGHQFMHYVAGHKGSRWWHRYGDQKFLEMPNWRERLGEYVEVNDRGEVVLTVDDSVRLARLHSDAFRNQLETIYLSCLDVSTERFQFVTQFYGDTRTSYVHQGTHAVSASAPTAFSGQQSATPSIGAINASPAPNTNPTGAAAVNPLTGQVQNSSYIQVQKYFATGGQFTADLINSFAWTVAGQEQSSYNSLASFSFIQPLLRGGGRVIALETLTIVERTLLNNLRAFQRYRQGLYTFCAVGDNTGVVGPVRRGGLLGGTGLTGFSGQGITGLGGVGAVTNYGGTLTPSTPSSAGAAYGSTGLAGGGAGTVGGVWGLVQQRQQIHNSEDTLALQERTLGLLEANQQAGLLDLAQVDQFRQNIQTERANLLGARVTLNNAIDQFKIAQLDFPPDVELALDETPISKFRLIDPKTRSLQFSLEDYVKHVGDLPQAPSESQFNQAVEQFETFREPIGQRFAAANNDLAKLQLALPARFRDMDKEKANDLREELAKLGDTYLELQTRRDKGFERLDKLHAAAQARPDNLDRLTDELVDLASGMSSLLGELSLVQARAKLEAISTTRIHLDPKRAFNIARANRLDWMNNRSQLVDTWRLIAYNANALLSNFSLTFSGDLGTTSNNPIKFAGSTGALKVGFQFDPPFTRRLERNNYVSSLVTYQQARRDLYLYYDSVNQLLRRYLRTLNLLDKNLEIQRSAVIIALRRVDQTREVLNKPPEPAAPGMQQTPLSSTAAIYLLNALSDLRNAQNNFMSVWVNHYAQRMLLMRDMGVMELDKDGLWIDRRFEEMDVCEQADAWMPPPVPSAWFRLAGIEDEHLLRMLAGPDFEKFDRDESEPAADYAPEEPRRLTPPRANSAAPDVVRTPPVAGAGEARVLELVRKLARRRRGSGR